MKKKKSKFTGKFFSVRTNSATYWTKNVLKTAQYSGVFIEKTHLTPEFNMNSTSISTSDWHESFKVSSPDVFDTQNKIKNTTLSLTFLVTQLVKL